MTFCSLVGRGGQLVIGRSQVQIPAPGKAELHVKVSLSTLHCSSVRALRWAGDLSRQYPALTLRQGWDWLQQQHPVTPWKGISGYGRDMTWHVGLLTDFCNDFLKTQTAELYYAKTRLLTEWGNHIPCVAERGRRFVEKNLVLTRLGS